MEYKEINFRDFLLLIWKKRLLIFILVFFSIIAGVIYSLSLPNYYHSKALLIPSDNSQNGTNILNQYGGLASLAGISMPNSSQKNKTDEAIVTIKSFDFFSKSILPSINLEDLLAVEQWNMNENSLKYNEDIFNPSERKWIREVSPPYTAIPSDQEAYEKFSSIMKISKEKNTPFVKLSIKHMSPYVAKEWTDLIINQINMMMRDKDKIKALKSIEFLNSQSSKISYDELKDVLSILLQEQIKSLMLIEANDYYIFDVIDSPIVPEKKSEPARLEIVMLFVLIGAFLSILFVLFNHYTKIFFRET